MPSASALFVAALPVPAGTPSVAPGVQGEAAPDAGLFSGKIAAILGAQVASGDADVSARGGDLSGRLAIPTPATAAAASDQKPVRLGAVRFLAETPEARPDTALEDQPTPSAGLPDAPAPDDEAAPGGDAPPLKDEQPTQAASAAPAVVPTPAVARTESAAVSTSPDAALAAAGGAEAAKAAAAPAFVDEIAKAGSTPDEAALAATGEPALPARRAAPLTTTKSSVGVETAQAEPPAKPEPDAASPAASEPTPGDLPAPRDPSEHAQADKGAVKTDSAPPPRTPPIDTAPETKSNQTGAGASSSTPAPPADAASQAKVAAAAAEASAVKTEAAPATDARPMASKAEAVSAPAASPATPAATAIAALTARVQPARAAERSEAPETAVAASKDVAVASPDAPVVAAPASAMMHARAIPAEVAAVLAVVDDPEPADTDVQAAPDAAGHAEMDDADVPAPATGRSSHEARPVERPVDRHGDRVPASDKAQADAATDKASTVPPPAPQAAKPVDAVAAAVSQPPAAVAVDAPVDPRSPAQQIVHASADRDLGLSSLSRATVETTAHLAAQMARKLEGRSTRFDMVLTPEDLGRVDVSIEIDADGQLAARLAFDNPAAAADLRGRADELRRQLQDAGFQVSGDSLDFTQRDPSSGGGFDRQQQRNALFAGGSRLAAQADAVIIPAPGAWINHSLTPERVDLKV